MATAVCPAGHESETTDYCDTCGAPIAAAPAGEAGEAGAASGAGEAPGPEAAGPAAPGPAAPETPAATPCPGCGEPVSGRFCESCGYDIESGTPAGPPPVTLVLGADRAHWERMVGEGEPAYPTVAPTLTFELTGDRVTLGRVRSGAAADVDIALTGAAADPAVSHHQCVFERSGDGWTVRDDGSANGTWVNDAGEPLAAGEAHELADGDRLLMGAWTSLTVGFGAAPEAAAPSSPDQPAAG